jgi:hypothetical protein
MIQITAPISHGSSGSPVIDENGQVIGIATLITKEGQNLGFAIAVEEVTRALAAPSKEQRLAPVVPGPQPTAPIYTPAQPSSDPRIGVLAFVKEFWSHSASNDSGDWASDFAAQTRYCYSDSGLADREFIRYDRAKLVDRYPVRHYKFYEPSIQMKPGGNSARVSFIYTYSYSGRRSAAGSCRVALTVEWNSGRWFITDYDEKVDRQ